MTQQEWLDNIRARSTSDNTINSAKSALSWWNNFITSKGLTDEEYIFILKELQYDPTLYKHLSDFVTYMYVTPGHDKKPLHAGTPKFYLGFIKEYLRFNSIRIYNEDVKQFIRFKKIPKEPRHAITPEEINKLFYHMNDRQKAVHLIQESGGTRIRETLQIRRDDINPDTLEVRIPAAHTKSNQGRSVHISQQAWRYVEPFYSKGGKYLFIKDTFKGNKTVRDYVTGLLRVCKKAGLYEKYENSRNNKITSHTLRAYFETVASLKHGGEYAHAVLGHSKDLIQYFRLPDEQKQSKYRELESHLKIRLAKPKDQKMSDL